MWRSIKLILFQAWLHWLSATSEVLNSLSLTHLHPHYKHINNNMYSYCYLVQAYTKTWTTTSEHTPSSMTDHSMSAFGVLIMHALWKKLTFIWPGVREISIRKCIQNLRLRLSDKAEFFGSNVNIWWRKLFIHASELLEIAMSPRLYPYVYVAIAIQVCVCTAAFYVCMCMYTRLIHSKPLLT